MCRHRFASRSEPPHEAPDWPAYALVIAQRCAKRYGLSSEDAHDCAMEFVARILVRCQWPDTRYVQESPSAAWLYRCAINHTIDFKRTRIRLHAHECFSLDTLHENISLVQESGCPCQMHLLQSWFRDQVVAAISCLSSRQQYVFVAYHVNDIPIRDIALALHVSPHAVEQCLFRARQRLRDLLTRQGVSPRDM